MNKHAGMAENILQPLTIAQNPAPQSVSAPHSEKITGQSSLAIGSIKASKVPDVTRILVPHTAFAEASGRIERCFELAVDATEPVCIALIGESRTGKSRVLETCCLNHPSRRLDDGMFVPIVRVKVQSKPTVKGLCELLLDALGAPDSHRGTEQEKTRRLKVLWKKTQSRMLMVDEFQHFVDKTTWLVQHHVADWLKIFVDDLHCTLVVAGLPSCKAVIDQNEQLAGRFLAPIEMPRFSWGNIEERREFKAILRTFHEALRADFDLPQFHLDEMAFRWYCATGGLIGYLTKILRLVVSEAVADKRKQITLIDLDQAHIRAVWTTSLTDAPRPFRDDFRAVETAELIERVALVGTAGIPPVTSRKILRNRSRNTASQVLVAK